MSDTSRATSGTGSAYSYTEEVSGWAGWVVFAGVMMVLLGFFHIVEGLVAIFNRGFYLVGPEGLVVNVDYTTWGWVHVIVGIVALLAGFGVVIGNMAARVVGVGLAMLSAILNLVFIAAYPVWSTIVIAVDVIIIYAIIVHGRELKALER